MKGKGKAIVGVVFAVAISFIFMGILMPIGLDHFHGADTSNWSSDTTDIWDTLPVMGVLVLLAVLGGWAYKSFT